MTLPAEPLIDYLRQLEAQGQTYVNVDDDARLLLREFYRRAQGMPSPAVGIAAAVSSPPVLAKRPVSVAISQPDAEVAIPEVPLGVVASGGNVDEKIASLKLQAASWAQTQKVGEFRDTMVFSTGDVRAEIMLVGEAPGFDEERLGEPFVGKAGQKLYAILKAMGTAREQVYLSNIVKY